VKRAVIEFWSVFLSLNNPWKQKEPIQVDILRRSSMPLHPTAFISYSWDDETHKKWVRDLATRLRTDGIDVRLDHWHTVSGDQLPEFMEREIRENDYVLVICTPKYKTKSEARIRGAGYEGDIITAEVLAKQNHGKFIPLLARGTWVEAAPSWLLGKRYVDLSDAARYDCEIIDLSLSSTQLLLFTFGLNFLFGPRSLEQPTSST
jgi:TIR domain